ncbi:hypothetical protein NHX12_033254 [Muraenolepis orangiensis]|uniref:Hydroxysteroid 11-beta-dehydrogenase 1-like protein n=1 Tax=Muraenolepis orangiensis TaxID=630683 RepID=A0A9Q0IJH0_9TELE|nr:hypothetical protein NHX12_033254 [Muraenolepis orangiensis]
MRTFTKLVLASVGLVFIAVKWSAPTFDPESLKGVRVLVTGASTGIGEQVAEKCLSLGAQKALYISADMSSDSDPDLVVSFALDQLGGLDHLILNHIGPSPFSMWDGDVAHIRWIMKMAWRSLPALEQSGGSLVVVSSLLGKMPSPFVAPYSSTKFALNGFFGSLQHELAMKKSNVSLSICTLGLIDTDNAMEKVKGKTEVPAYPASEAALNVVIAGATRQPEVFYPWFTYIISVVKDWCPCITNYSIRNSYSYEP